MDVRDVSMAEVEAEIERTRVRQIIPAQGWEVLETVVEEDGSLSMQTVPVLAWGLTQEGCVEPVLPNDLGGTSPWSGVGNGTYAVARIGQPEVYTADGTTYYSRDRWLDVMRKKYG